MDAGNGFYWILGGLGFLYVMLYVVIGFVASRKIQTQSEYFFANKGIGIWFLSATLIATQVGGGMLLGSAAEAYKYGFGGILYSLGMCIGFLLLGCGFASKLRAAEASTNAELLEKKFGSKGLRKVASTLSILSLCGILAAQFVGLKSILLAIGVTEVWISVIIWMMFVLCTMAGGLKAVVATDAWQIVFILLTFGGIFAYVIAGEPGISTAGILQMQSAFESSEADVNRLFGILMIPALFSLIEQDLAQRFFAASTKRVAWISALVSSFVILVFAFVPVYLGMKANQTGIEILEGANPLIAFVGALSNPWILAIAVIAIVAAIVSTADSLLCAASSNLIYDFGWVGLSGSVWKARWTTLGIGLLSLFIGLQFNNIIDIMIKSYELMIGCIFVPILLSLFLKNPKKSAAMLSIILGIAGFICTQWMTFAWPKELLPIGLSLTGFLLGSIPRKQKCVFEPIRDN